MNSGFPAGRVDLDRLRQGPVEWSGRLPAEKGAWGLDGLRVAEAPWLQYRAESGGRSGVRVVGEMSATACLVCRRCLVEVQWPIKITFDFRFNPAVQEWEEEAGVFTMDPNAAALDLVRPLREEWVLAMPEYPVCQDGCRGLCPVCGADLNESECGCTTDRVDPRWDVLRQMASDGQSESAEPE
jgi:uncharacterized protein